MRQTKRQLETKVKEYKRIKDINKKSSSLSVISEHRMNEQYEFDWDNVHILNNEASYVKRTLSEMIYIKKQTSGLNRQSDIELLELLYPT